MTGTRVTIRTPPQDGPWTLAQARALLAESALHDEVCNSSLRVLERLATGQGSGEPRASDPLGTLDTILAIVGVVAGRSSGRDGLVLNEIVARVLGARPIPRLLPAELDPGEGWAEGAKEGEATSASDSLLCDYLLR